MRVYELVGSLQTYKMTLPDSQKGKEFDFRAFENEKEKKIENPKGITRKTLTHMCKCVKQAFKLNKRSNKN